MRDKSGNLTIGKKIMIDGQQRVTTLITVVVGMKVLNIDCYSWWFGFGTITVTTGGVTSSYPFIADPLAFRREINMQIG